MIVEKIAKEWLLTEGYDETDSDFQSSLDSLCDLLEDAAENGYLGEEEFDPQVGENTLCLCGHTYYRHFDPYDNMAPVGCKYCSHYTYHSNGIQHHSHVCTGFKKDENTNSGTTRETDD